MYALDVHIDSKHRGQTKGQTRLLPYGELTKSSEDDKSSSEMTSELLTWSQDGESTPEMVTESDVDTPALACQPGFPTIRRRPHEAEKAAVVGCCVNNTVEGPSLCNEGRAVTTADRL